MPSSLSQPETIPFIGKFLPRFYEPLVLLKVMNLATRMIAIPAKMEASIDTEDPDEIYKAFVYKLGHICDSSKGWKTITSFFILKEDDVAHYWFASNQRTHEELTKTRDYLTRIFTKLQKTPQTSNTRRALFLPILSDVLAFNRNRVSIYIRQMEEQIYECISLCFDNLHETHKEIGDDLQELINHVEFDTLTISDDEFVKKCNKLLKYLERIRYSRVGKVILENARDGPAMPGIRTKECWSELQHTMNRLLAYEHSVLFILKAKELWPALFEHFEISFCESSKILPRPTRKKSHDAHSILGRMTSDLQDMEKFRELVRELQMFDLDEKIKEEYGKASFRLVVHSEVLLHHQLQKRQLLHPRYFFNQCMYIGSSKPTCLLCKYYFEVSDSKVGCRDTHGNLYLGWRYPDVLQTEGVLGEKRRRSVMEKILRKVRRDAFRVVRTKAPSSYKGEDSFTYSAALPIDRSSDDESDATVDDLASVMGQLDLD